MTNGHAQTTQTAVNVPDGNHRYLSGGTSSFNMEITHEELNTVGMSPRSADAGYAGHSPSATPPRGGLSAMERSPAAFNHNAVSSESGNGKSGAFHSANRGVFSTGGSLGTTGDNTAATPQAAPDPLRGNLDDSATLATLQRIERGAAVASTRSDDVKKAFVGAAAALLALAVGASALQPVGRGYIDAKACFYGSGAYLAPTVTQCVDMCDNACPQFITECALMCAGGSPDLIIPAVKNAALRIHAASVVDPRDVRFIEVAMQSPDKRVRIVATAIAAETPFVSLGHSEQGL